MEISYIFVITIYIVYFIIYLFVKIHIKLKKNFRIIYK